MDAATEGRRKRETRRYNRQRRGKRRGRWRGKRRGKRRGRWSRGVKNWTNCWGKNTALSPDLVQLVHKALKISCGHIRSVSRNEVYLVYSCVVGVKQLPYEVQMLLCCKKKDICSLTCIFEPDLGFVSDRILVLARGLCE